MSTQYTNKFILCNNVDLTEMTIEFFCDEPIFDVETNAVSPTTTSISKLVMSSNTAKNLYQVLGQTLGILKAE